MAATKRDYYEVLGISRTATPEDVKKAFRQKARQYHPDVNKEPGAEAQFKEISEAYEVLIDDDKRAAYDRFGHAAVVGRRRGAPATIPSRTSAPSPTSSRPSSQPRPQAAATGTRPRRAQRGAHLAYRLTVEFEEAMFGSEKEIEIPRLATCPRCEGSGAEPGTEPQVCPVCNGRGEVRRTQQSIFGQFVSVVPCDRCHGEGKIVATPCTECKGEGRIRETRKLAVKIPAGIEDGAQIRLAGEGEAGPRGAPPGDLYIEVTSSRTSSSSATATTSSSTSTSIWPRPHWVPRSRCPPWTAVRRPSRSRPAPRTTRSCASRAWACPTCAAQAGATCSSR